MELLKLLENNFAKTQKENLFSELSSFIEKNSEKYKINGFNINKNVITLFYEKNKTITYELKEV